MFESGECIPYITNDIANLTKDGEINKSSDDSFVLGDYRQAEDNCNKLGNKCVGFTYDTENNRYFLRNVISGKGFIEKTYQKMFFKKLRFYIFYIFNY